MTEPLPPNDPRIPSPLFEERIERALTEDAAAHIRVGTPAGTPPNDPDMAAKIKVEPTITAAPTEPPDPNVMAQININPDQATPSTPPTEPAEVPGINILPAEEEGIKSI